MLVMVILRAFRILGVQKTRTINISLLVALFGSLGLTILIGSLYPHDRVAVAAPYATPSGHWPEINCLETEVEEGADWVRVKHRFRRGRTGRDFQTGTHYFAVGTPYQSTGNTGEYTVLLVGIDE